LAERSQRQTFRVEPPARQFGRTKPMAALTTAFSVTLCGCHRPRKRTIQYPPKAVRGAVFSAIGPARSTGCSACDGHDKRERRHATRMTRPSLRPPRLLTQPPLLVSNAETTFQYLKHHGEPSIVLP
jgi:hypothetical protein